MKKFMGICCGVAMGIVKLVAADAGGGANPVPEQEIQYPPEVKASMAEAAKAAQEWLKLIDAGKFAESWDRAAPRMQITIPKDEWVKAMEIVRKRIGPFRSRTFKNEAPAWNPKGLAPGAYMVLRYDAEFGNARAVELITLSQQNDGQWKVLTYNFDK